MIIQSRIKRLTARVLMVVITWAVLFLVFDRLLMPLYTRKFDEVAIPNFVGEPMFEAMSGADKAGFTIVRERTRPDAKHNPETIVDQRPAAGEKAKKGRTIFVTVAARVSKVKVPSLYELTPREAALKLEDDGLHLEISAPEMEYSDLVTPGDICHQEPAPGTAVATASDVKIYLSKGPEPGKARVPDLIGIALDKAVRQLKQAGLHALDPVYERSLDFAEGEVIRQNPPSGSVLEAGGNVELVVSSGKNSTTLKAVKQ